MKADIQTFNCLGCPIEIRINGKRNPEYRKMVGLPEEMMFRTHKASKSALLGEADFYRRHPDQYADSANPWEDVEDVEGRCEWAFVIEQLVAEGTL